MTKDSSAEASVASATVDTGPINEEIAKKFALLRAQVRENFGKIAMAMMMLPRYRHQSIADLQHLVLEPLVRDRIALAYPGDAADADPSELAGMAIWASVSEEVDAKIREQIGARIWPIRLKPDEWNSGTNNWLLDVIAQDEQSVGKVIANFRQVAKQGSLKIHPLIAQLVNKDVLEKLGAKKMGD